MPAMPRFPAPLRQALATLLLAGAALVPHAAMARKPASLPMATCINLGNHLDMAHGGEIQHNRLGPADFARIKAAGFDTVRLPVNWSSHSLATPPYTIDPAWFARVDQVVDGALHAGLKVILNSHNFEAINTDPVGAQPWFTAVWQQIADHYASRPRQTLWFEIENEPKDALDNANLVTTFAPALAAIRRHNPNRPVIIGGEKWSNITSLATLNLPDDPQVWPTFHYYEPFAFTHQGATWVSPSPPLGRTYGEPADLARLPVDVQRIKAYVARTGKIPLMGETGAFESIPIDQRIAYYRSVFKTFHPLGVPICVWAYTNTFPFFDAHKGQWIPGLRGAIGLPETSPKR
ncbi:endoglucanase [Novosphingobium sp. 1529]|uniref:glycoside hydrolase family 5 protein n=1 Tax=Novosphingobium sp. 1529 TaxID=3156424 RepID=UPI003398B305